MRWLVFCWLLAGCTATAPAGTPVTFSITVLTHTFGNQVPIVVTVEGNGMTERRDFPAADLSRPLVVPSQAVRVGDRFHLTISGAAEGGCPAGSGELAGTATDMTLALTTGQFGLRFPYDAGTCSP